MMCTREVGELSRKHSAPHFSDRIELIAYSALGPHSGAIVQVVMEREELFGEELELILDHYPASLSPQSVEEEDEPGALPSEFDAPKELPERSDWRSADSMSAQSESSTVSRDETVDKWLLAGVRSMDPVEVERLGVGGGYSGEERERESESAEGRWVDVQSKPNGTVEAQKKEPLESRGEAGSSWESSLEVGDVAATNRSGGYGESSPPPPPPSPSASDASIAASVSLTGKNDIHD